MSDVPPPEPLGLPTSVFDETVNEPVDVPAKVDKPKPKKTKEEATVFPALPGSSKTQFHADVKFPIYSAKFIAEDLVLLAGGGGVGRNGVDNRLAIYRIQSEPRQLQLVTKYILSNEEDAPMTIAIHPESHSLVAGINSNATRLSEGINKNLKSFKYANSSIAPVGEFSTTKNVSPDHYQKVTAFSRPIIDPNAISEELSKVFIGTGSTDSQLTVGEFDPATGEVKDLFEKFYKPERSQGSEEIYDVDFNDGADLVMGCSSQKLQIYSTALAPKDDLFLPGPLVQTIDKPTLPNLSCTFRAAKFGRGPTASNIYTVVNTTPSTGIKKGVDRKIYVSIWDRKEWKLIRTKAVGKKPATAFEVSNDGTMIAYGSSDLSIGVLDSANLQSLQTVLQAHDFPPTSLTFNPSGTMLLSASADGTVRIVSIPPPDQRKAGVLSISGPGMIFWAIVLLLISIWLSTKFSS